MSHFKPQHADFSARYTGIASWLPSPQFLPTLIIFLTPNRASPMLVSIECCLTRYCRLLCRKPCCLQSALILYCFSLCPLCSLWCQFFCFLFHYHPKKPTMSPRFRQIYDITHIKPPSNHQIEKAVGRRGHRLGHETHLGQLLGLQHPAGDIMHAVAVIPKLLPEFRQMTGHQCPGRFIGHAENAGETGFQDRKIRPEFTEL